MTDLVKVLREYKELMAGLSPEVIAWLEELATKPGTKLTIPTPYGIFMKGNLTNSYKEIARNG